MLSIRSLKETRIAKFRADTFYPIWVDHLECVKMGSESRYASTKLANRPIAHDDNRLNVSVKAG